MPYELYLIRRPDLQASDGEDPDIFDLQKYLAGEGWAQGTPQPNQDRIDEAVSLHLKPDAGEAQDDDGLALLMHALDLKVRQVAIGQSFLAAQGIWLRAKQSTETKARQSLVTAARRSPTMKVRSLHSAANDYVIADYVLGLTRMPYWEAQEIRTITPEGGGTLDTNGGMFAYDFDSGILGDAPYRVARMVLTPETNNVLTEFWFGARSNHYYDVDPANFVPVWNLAIADHQGTDVESDTDANALSGTRLTCSFDTHEEMVERCTMTASRASPSYPNDQIGTYIILLRAAMSDGSSEALVRVGGGFHGGSSTTEFAFQSSELVSGTFYRYFELGTVSIPASYMPLRDGFLLFTAALQVQAQRLSGTGDLYLDSLILVPAEHHLHFTQANVQDIGGGSTRFTEVYTLPDDRVMGKAYDLTLEQPMGNLDIDDARTWALPVQSIDVVCVAQGSVTSFKGVDVGVSMQVIPRWDSLRGAD